MPKGPVDHCTRSHEGHVFATCGRVRASRRVCLVHHDHQRRRQSMPSMQPEYKSTIAAGERSAGHFAVTVPSYSASSASATSVSSPSASTLAPAARDLAPVLSTAISPASFYATKNPAPASSPLRYPTNATSRPPSPTLTEPTSPELGPASVGSAPPTDDQQPYNADFAEHAPQRTPLAQENTMVSNKFDSMQQFTSTHTDGKELKQEIVHECSGKFTGPMSAEEFLRRYVPCPPLNREKKQRRRPKISWNDVLTAKGEIAMYEPFVCCLFSRPSHLLARTPQY